MDMDFNVIIIIKKNPSGRTSLNSTGVVPFQCRENESVSLPISFLLHCVTCKLSFVFACAQWKQVSCEVILLSRSLWVLGLWIDVDKSTAIVLFAQQNVSI